MEILHESDGRVHIVCPHCRANIVENVTELVDEPQSVQWTSLRGGVVMLHTFTIGVKSEAFKGDEISDGRVEGVVGSESL